MGIQTCLFCELRAGVEGEEARSESGVGRTDSGSSGVGGVIGLRGWHYTGLKGSTCLIAHQPTLYSLAILHIRTIINQNVCPVL